MVEIMSTSNCNLFYCRIGLRQNYSIQIMVNVICKLFCVKDLPFHIV